MLGAMGYDPCLHEEFCAKVCVLCTHLCKLFTATPSKTCICMQINGLNPARLTPARILQSPLPQKWIWPSGAGGT
jgi:hypothetical protein